MNPYLLGPLVVSGITAFLALLIARLSA